MEYVKGYKTKISDLGISESDIQKVIASDPGILGLGPLKLISREMHITSGGKCDVVLQDDSCYYAVEIQLGPIDADHIVRSIEYTDLLKESLKAYDSGETQPQKESVAILIAESFDARYRNVIERIKNSVPFIGLEMHAHKVGDKYTLAFFEIFNTAPAYIDHTEPDARCTRKHWEEIAGKSSLNLCDDILKLIVEFSGESYEYNWKARHVGLLNAQKLPFNFIEIVPTRQGVTFKPRLECRPDFDKLIESYGCDYGYEKSQDRYRINITADNLARCRTLIQTLVNECLK